MPEPRWFLQGPTHVSPWFEDPCPRFKVSGRWGLPCHNLTCSTRSKFCNLSKKRSSEDAPVQASAGLKIKTSGPEKKIFVFPIALIVGEKKNNKGSGSPRLQPGWLGVFLGHRPALRPSPSSVLINTSLLKARWTGKNSFLEVRLALRPGTL